jgi:AhpD family alkylhydroperoxidase
MTTTPRIPPGSAADIGRRNALIAKALGAAMGTGPPNIFTTLSRHRRLFLPWLRFAGRLMPGGKLPRADTELLILRTAHNSGCEYEWRHHERIGQAAGMSRQEIQRVREDVGAGGWGERQTLLLRAADELHVSRVLSDEVFDGLRPLLSDAELIEVCMLVGHYEMLAMTLNSLQVAPDEFEGAGPGRFVSLLSRMRRS